jgi:prephenate dehydrogenase
VCDALRGLDRRYGFTFIGGHPMAGLEKSGFDAAKATLFSKASMLLTPPPDIDQSVLEEARAFFLSIGFAQVKLCTPDAHDRMIAYTSQLAHVLSSAYIQCPEALEHYGFSAGSFRDMTRVAYLNEDMWTELFLLNTDRLAEQIDGLCERLAQYSQAIKTQDAAALKALLRAGREKKTLCDGGENPC